MRDTQRSRDWGAIFDWDGVIIDSSTYHERSWEMLAEQEGLALPPGHFKRGFGMKNDVIIPGVLKWASAPEEVERLAVKKEELYRQLLRALNNDATSMSKAFYTREIRKEVRELIKEKGQKPVVIVDEASLLRLEVLIELHTIAQFEGDSKPWLPIILAGQINLEDNLRYRKALALASRVVARGSLDAVKKDEMDQYLNHHLSIAGVKTPLFSDAALTAIFQGSGGIYRKANNLARGALIAAAVEKASQVIPDHVQIASSEIF